MIYELAVAEYPRIRALVAGLAYHLSIQAVIEGTVAGRIWVDNALAPQAAFIITPEGQHLAGEPADPTFQQALADLLLNMPGLNLNCASDAWESALAPLFTCKFARPFPRRYYTFRQFLLPDWREQVPPGYEMARIDLELLAREDLVNIGNVRRQITEWKDFGRDGFGFCLVHGDSIVSQCIADCVSGSACELGITTHRDYRRRGLGALTTAATVEYCLDHHLPTIGWHCWANNRGSQRVAEKVGFGLVGEYRHYANGALAENADDLTPVEWQAHADFFERAFEMLSQHGARMAWRAAQARALAGESTQAMTLLHRLADSETMPPGWDAWLRESWAFQSLQTDPGWQTLVARAQTAHLAEREG